MPSTSSKSAEGSGVFLVEFFVRIDEDAKNDFFDGDSDEIPWHLVECADTVEAIVTCWQTGAFASSPVRRAAFHQERMRT